MSVLSKKGYRIKIFTKSNKKRAFYSKRCNQKREAIRIARRMVRTRGLLLPSSASVSIDERNGALIYQCHAKKSAGKLVLVGDEL